MKTNPRLVWASNSRMIKTPSLIDVLRSTLERVEQSVKLTPDDPALREFKRHIPRMIAENRGNRKQPRPVVIMASHITMEDLSGLPVFACDGCGEQSKRDLVGWWVFARNGQKTQFKCPKCRECDHPIAFRPR